MKKHNTYDYRLISPLNIKDLSNGYVKDSILFITKRTSSTIEATIVKFSDPTVNQFSEDIEQFVRIAILKNGFMQDFTYKGAFIENDKEMHLTDIDYHFDNANVYDASNILMDSKPSASFKLTQDFANDTVLYVFDAKPLTDEEEEIHFNVKAVLVQFPSVNVFDYPEIYFEEHINPAAFTDVYNSIDTKSLPSEYIISTKLTFGDTCYVEAFGDYVENVYFPESI